MKTEINVEANEALQSKESVDLAEPLNTADPSEESPTANRVVNPSANPLLCGFFAELFPGAGYLYAGSNHDAALASTLAIPLFGRHFVPATTWSEAAAKANVVHTSRDVFGYTVYDSFQSCLSQPSRAKLKIADPHYRFGQLFMAPTQIENYRNWKVAVPAAIYLLNFVSRLSQDGISSKLTPSRALVSIPLIIASMFLTGVGEESEFRGYQHVALAEATNRPVGNVLQAASFGLCHTRTGICSSPYLSGNIARGLSTLDPAKQYAAPSSQSDGGDLSDLEYFVSAGLAGLYFGYIHQSEPDGLLKSITVHALGNTLLTLGDLLTSGNTGRMYLSVNLAF